MAAVLKVALVAVVVLLLSMLAQTVLALFGEGEESSLAYLI
jgi:hypothetical protein